MFSQILFIFTPKLVEDEPNLTISYFSDGLGKNHQLASYTLLYIYFQPFIGATHGLPSIFFTRLQGPHTEWSQVRWPRPPKTQPNQQWQKLFPYHPLGLVYIPTFWLIFIGNVGKYTSPMDGMRLAYGFITIKKCLFYYVFTIALLFSPS